MHRKAHLRVCHTLPHTRPCPSHSFMSTVTQCTCRHTPCSPSHSSQTTAPRPHLFCTERHMGHTRTRMHGTCVIMPAGVTYTCTALHVGRRVHTGASRHRHRHPEATHRRAQPHMLFPQVNPSLSVPLESRLTRFPFSPSGPWGPGRPTDP